MSKRAFAPISAALALLLLAGCGDDAEQSTISLAAELSATGAGKYLGLLPDGVQSNGEWQEYRYDPAKEKAICLRGTPYQVNVRAGRVNKVLLYLEGGGACWNHSNCWLTPQAKLTAGSAFGAAALDSANPENPFRDWTVVYASYCDGSVFAGDNIVFYDGNRTFHHGLANLSAAVTLMQRDVPAPEMIVVSGSSAGGFGTYTGYAVTRIAYPQTEILVFDDSGPGLQNPNETTSVMERETNWRFREIIPSSCTDCGEQLTFLSNWAVERDPTLRVAYFNYQQDPVLRFFLNMNAISFRALLLDITGQVVARHPQRIKRFLPRGSLHTVLQLPTFFTHSIDGVTVRDWTAAFLANDQTVWRDLVEP
jgi:hypothetical protein